MDWFVRLVWHIWETYLACGVSVIALWQSLDSNDFLLFNKKRCALTNAHMHIQPQASSSCGERSAVQRVSAGKRWLTLLTPRLWITIIFSSLHSLWAAASSLSDSSTGKWCKADVELRRTECELPGETGWGHRYFQSMCRRLNELAFVSWNNQKEIVSQAIKRNRTCSRCVHKCNPPFF